MASAVIKQLKAENGFLTTALSNLGDTTATKLTVDNIEIDGNSITAIDTDGDIYLTTNGSGAVVLSTLTATNVNATNLSGTLTGNVNGNVTGNLNGNVTGNVNGNITSTGTSTFATIDVNGGAIDNTPIGASTASTGRFTDLTATSSITGSIGNTSAADAHFTTLEANGITSLTAGIASTTTSNGTLVVTGGVGISGSLNVGGNLAITGTASASTPVSSNDLTNKQYVDGADLRSLAYAVAFGL